MAGAEVRLTAVEARTNGLGSQLQAMESKVRSLLGAADARVAAMEASLQTLLNTMEARFQAMMHQLQPQPGLPPQHPSAPGVPAPPGMSGPSNSQTNHEVSPHPHNSKWKTIVIPKSDVSTLSQFDGGHKSDPDLWYKKVRSHLIAQNRDIQYFLDWAESKGPVRISMGEVMSYVGMSDLDPLTISSELWGFLDANLCGDAHSGFLGVEETNGADAWRKVVRSIHGETPVRRLALKRQVDSPEEAKDMGQVMTKIENWEEKLRKYKRLLPVLTRSPYS